MESGFLLPAGMTYFSYFAGTNSNSLLRIRLIRNILVVLPCVTVNFWPVVNFCLGGRRTQILDAGIEFWREVIILEGTTPPGQVTPALNSLKQHSLSGN